MNFRLKIRQPLAILASLVLAACTTSTPAPTVVISRGGNGARAATTPTAVPSQIIATQSIVTVDGALSLNSPALALGFGTSGKVRSVKVKVGQTVNLGEILATIDDAALQDAVIDAQANLDAIRASVAQQAIPATKEDIAAAEASLNSAYASYNTVSAGSLSSDIEASRKSVEGARIGLQSSQASRDLACSSRQGTTSESCKQAEASLGNAYEGWISAQDVLNKLLAPPTGDALTQSNASIVSAKNKLAALKAGISDTQQKVNDTQIAQAAAALQRAQDALASSQLLAPCQCTVQEITVSPGSSAGATAFTLVNLSGIQFKTTNVSERDIAKLKPGATASVRLRSYAEPMTAHVASILAQSSGTQGNTATFTVLLDIDKSPRLLLPGMTGQADVTVGPGSP